jgi:hypothetical protein
MIIIFIIYAKCRLTLQDWLKLIHQWQLYHIRSEFLSRSRLHHQINKVVFASPTMSIDAVRDTEKFQAGGCLTMALGPWATSIHKDTVNDKSGLGRWSGFTVIEKNKRAVTIITGYRTCKGSIQSAGVNTTFHREYEHYRSLGVQSPRPRRLFLKELGSQIQSFQQHGHALIVMMDANETLLPSQGDLRSWISQHDLHDIHELHPAPSTYIGSTHRRIDFMFGCHQILPFIHCSGTLSYIDGPQSDHRSLYIDVALSDYLNYDANNNTNLPIATRNLRTGNPELVQRYHQVMLQYYKDHKMIERIDELYSCFSTLSQEETRQRLESWDRDQGRAMKAAEKAIGIPKKNYEWSPQLRNAAITKRYWKLRLRETKYPGEDYTTTIKRLQETIQQNQPQFQFPKVSDAITIDQARNGLTKATKELKRLQKTASGMRFLAYQDLLATYATDLDPVTRPKSNRKAKIVKRTIRTERIRRMFRNIKLTIQRGPISQYGISQIKVPKIPVVPDASLPGPDQFQSYISTANPNDIVWDTILDQATIEDYLLKYNRQSFRAAAASPCGHGVIYDALSFTSLTPAAKDFLSGVFPMEWYGKDKILREFLMSFMIPSHIQYRPHIRTSVTEEDVQRGFGKWKESTSTSPSGRHLGHYKALIQDPVLLSCLTKFMNIAVKSGISISRWSRATNVMLEKDPGNPCIHRLRIIHLFEADFNFYMKIQWGKRLVCRATKHQLLNTGQFGSVPNHSPMEPIMLTQLSNDSCRLLKHNLARFDNDASACFDRIIVPLAMLAARRCGMSEASVKIHAETLRQMSYAVKTQYGVSQSSYCSTDSEPLFGTGQGSGASPAAWLTLVVIMMNTMDRLVSERVTFRSPDTSMCHERLIDAFVDDTSISFTDSGDKSYDDMVATITSIASLWDRLLFYSGGSLNLQKCAWHITYWEWEHGRPRLRTPNSNDKQIVICSAQTGKDETIKQQHYHQSSRILGAHLTPSGEFATQLSVMRDKADNYAIKLRSPRLRPSDIWTFIKTTYVPAMRYVLPCLAVDEEELNRVQSKFLASALQKLGLSSKMPTAVRHGPKELGVSIFQIFEQRSELNA